MANTLIDELDNPFWQFSLKIYQHEEVKEDCLWFQNQEGANVNLLLLCCWLACAVEEISQREFNEACLLIDSWQQHVTQALRRVRQYLKNAQRTDWVKHFYQHVLADEISSEAYQQFILYTHFADKQKNKVMFNERLLLAYLHCLFENTKSTQDENLKLKIHSFTRKVQSIIEQPFCS